MDGTENPFAQTVLKVCLVFRFFFLASHLRINKSVEVCVNFYISKFRPEKSFQRLLHFELLAGITSSIC